MTYQASKWLKIALLSDPAALAGWLDSLGPVRLVRLGKVLKEPEVLKEIFNFTYQGWVEALKAGRMPEDFSLLPIAVTLEEGSLRMKELPQGKLAQIIAPVLQIQAHFFRYSPVDGSIRSMVLSSDSIFWGIQFSYPQIYQDPDTMELSEAMKRPNAALWNKVRAFSRDTSQPTPFIVDGISVNSPIRIGKACLPWIGSHPQLKEIYVRR